MIPFHGHVIKRDNNLLTILPIKSLNLEHIAGQMIDILFFTCMRKATQVTATDNVNVILRYKESLCVLELFDVDFIVIVEVETSEIVASEEEDFVGGKGVDLEDLLADWEGDGLVVGVGDQLV